MTKLSVFPKLGATSLVRQNNWKRYCLLAGILNSIIWGITIIYLEKTAPVYSSQWSISLNGGKYNTNVNLPGIGQTSSSSESSYNPQSSDPRENYMFLITTRELLESAAKQMNLPVRKFGKPKTKTLNNTTIMQFEIQAESPQLAQKKAFALQRALESRLNDLRLEEISQRGTDVQPALEPIKEKLKEAQQRLYNYKARSTLSLTDQLKSASDNLEGLRRSYAEATAQLKQVQVRLGQLSSSLGLSSAEAADALVLQSDKLFQEYLTAYSKSTTELALLNSTYTPKSPIWMAKQKEISEVYGGLMQQSKLLLGRSISPVKLKRISLGNNNSVQQADLFQQLLLLQDQYQGQKANVVTLNQQINQLEIRKRVLSQEEAKLSSLERDVKIADAMYTSNLTRLDLSKFVTSPSYPPMSIITKPSLAKEPTSPNKKFALLGATLGSFLITIGTTTLWFRNYKLK